MQSVTYCVTCISQLFYSPFLFLLTVIWVACRMILLLLFICTRVSVFHVDVQSIFSQRKCIQFGRSCFTLKQIPLCMWFLLFRLVVGIRQGAQLTTTFFFYWQQNFNLLSLKNSNENYIYAFHVLNCWKEV